MSIRVRQLLMSVAVVVLAGSQATGRINANFTPVDMLGDASLVLVVKLKPVVKNKAQTIIQRVLVGKKPAESPVIDVSGGSRPEHAKAVARMMAAIGNQEVLLVAGKNEQGDEAAWMHVAGKWADIYTEDNKLWEVEQINSEMEGTWAGGTDMLIRCFDYMQKDDDPDVPVDAGCQWGENVKVGKIEGKVYSASAVDLTGKGKFDLFIAAEKGDRFFSYNEAKDAFVERKLPSRSRKAAWADFNADGRLDLVSWDGSALVLWLQKKDGTFPAKGAKLGFDAGGGCLGLTVLDVGAGGRPAILVTTTAGLVLLKPQPSERPLTPTKKTYVKAFCFIRQADGCQFAPTKLDAGKHIADGKLGAPASCLVGDFDNDGMPDVLQVFANGGLFYKATAPGVFAAAVPNPVSAGKGPTGSTIGDYDGDGMFDVFATGKEGKCRLWHNRGKMKMQSTLGISGEIAYISKPNAAVGMACDINNDGRQDAFIAYAAMGPHIFFNRGYRSFGHAHGLDLIEKAFLPESEAGQQAGTVADLNHDGAQDMVIVLTDGNIWLFPREVMDAEGPARIEVALPLGGSYAGPVKVTAWIKARCLGAWNVMPGTREACFYGISEAGKVTVKWQLPGKAEQKKVLEVKEGATRIVIKQ